MREPGNAGGATVRLTISGKREQNEQLIRLKHKLEAKGTASHLSISKVFWLAIECLANAEGIM